MSSFQNKTVIARNYAIKDFVLVSISSKIDLGQVLLISNLHYHSHIQSISRNA